MLNANLSFVSVGANRIANCSDWATKNGLFAYAGNVFVVLYDAIKVIRKCYNFYFFVG